MRLREEAEDSVILVSNKEGVRMLLREDLEKEKLKYFHHLPAKAPCQEEELCLKKNV